MQLGWQYDQDNPQIILCIGGDGTLLRAIHQIQNKLVNLLFVGIHTGTLGFFTDYTQYELADFFTDLQKEPVIESAPLLQIDLLPKQISLLALNEARIESSKTLSLDIRIDGEYFETATASGLCISTQAGSTAINRALGGAVVDPGLSVFQLVEIMPISHRACHSLRNPYIMKNDRVITISGNLKDARLCYDHKEISLQDTHIVQIANSGKTVKFARFKTYSYLKRLKTLY
jgi:NAD+ kinase